jgi:hypothetical protein
VAAQADTGLTTIRPTAHPFRLAALCVLGILVGSGQAVDSTYFEQTASASESGSAPVGTTVYAGIAVLDIRPGDRVRFVSIDPPTAGVRALAGPIRGTDATIGIERETDLTAADLGTYVGLSTRSFGADDGPIGIVLEIATPRDQLDIIAPTLTFTVNDGAPQHERLLMAVQVCASPSPIACVPPDPPAVPGS